MNIEQRLIAALQKADRTQPSPDLFSRVVHSIDEDRLHRRRVRLAGLQLVITAALMALALKVSMVDGFDGRQVRWQAMEVIETAVLVMIVVVLGPAIRRFGRGYVHDLWPSTRDTASALLRLLDLAYGLVFSGYILLSCEFTAPGLRDSALSDQLRAASERIGGLIITIGILHVVTIGVLPLVALVSNSTRVGKPLPRWVSILLGVMGVIVGFEMFVLLIGMVATGFS